uniref:Transmembrane protein n=1 Tax=Neospora caninum (strain Liverpool) TaxID=572307 RepID=A0A0F7UMM3_NEOCL|nr:TPA: hypothetical protein BN1204_059565 [Neospora caninum Liverpool]
MSGNGKSPLSFLILLVLLTTFLLSWLAEDATSQQPGSRPAQKPESPNETKDDTAESGKGGTGVPPPVEMPELYGCLKFLDSWILSFLATFIPETRFWYLVSRPIAYLNDVSDRESARELEHANQQYMRWYHSHKRAQGRREGVKKLIEGTQRREESRTPSSRLRTGNEQASSSPPARVEGG